MLYKQEAHGLHRSLGKHLLKNILEQSYEYTTRMVKCHHYLLLKEACTSICTNVNYLYSKCFVSSFVEFVLVVLKCFQCFFRYHLPFEESEESGALHVNKLELPSPKDALCKVWLELTRWFLRIRQNCEKRLR